MGYSRRYDRVFVSLTGERSDFNISADKSALGSCLLEIKNGAGKLSISVQGLKPEILYRAYIIAEGKTQNSGLSIGLVKVDSKGRGELKIEFNPDDVMDSGLEIEKFNIVALLVPKDNEIISPLVGYTGNPVMWKNTFVDIKNNKEKIMTKLIREESPAKIISREIISEEMVSEEAVIEKPVSDTALFEEAVTEETVTEETVSEKIIPEESVFEKKEPFLETSAEAQDNYHDTFRKLAIQFRKEMKELEYYKNLTVENTRDTSHRTQSHNKYGHEHYEYGRPFPDLSHMFENNAKMKPFENQYKKIKWIRISLDDLSSFDNNLYKHISEPFVRDSYNKYKHILLGKYEEPGRYKYALGLPDVYDSSRRLHASRLGFRQFKSCDDKSSIHGEYGYWLMFF